MGMSGGGYAVSYLISKEFSTSSVYNSKFKDKITISRAYILSAASNKCFSLSFCNDRDDAKSLVDSKKFCTTARSKRNELLIQDCAEVNESVKHYLDSLLDFQTNSYSSQYFDEHSREESESWWYLCPEKHSDWGEEVPVFMFNHLRDIESTDAKGAFLDQFKDSADFANFQEQESKSNDLYQSESYLQYKKFDTNLNKTHYFITDNSDTSIQLNLTSIKSCTPMFDYHSTSSPTTIEMLHLLQEQEPPRAKFEEECNSETKRKVIIISTILIVTVLVSGLVLYFKKIKFAKFFIFAAVLFSVVIYAAIYRDRYDLNCSSRLILAVASDIVFVWSAIITIWWFFKTN